MSSHTEIWKSLRQLQADLQKIVNKDPGSDVGDLAIPVLDFVVSECEDFLGDDPLVKRLRGAIDPDRPDRPSYSPPKAANILIVVGQLLARIGMPEEMRRVVQTDPFRRSW